MSAEGINESGQETGSVMLNGAYSAYVRHANGTVVVLPQYGPAGTSNFGYAINDVGEVAGRTDGYRGLRWSPAIGGWTVSSLGILLSLPRLEVRDINNSGWIVGTAWSLSSAFSAFVQIPGQAIRTDRFTRRTRRPERRMVGEQLRQSAGRLHCGGSKSRLFSWTSFGGMKDEAAVRHFADRSAISDKGRIAGIQIIDVRSRAFTVYQGIYNMLPARGERAR